MQPSYIQTFLDEFLGSEDRVIVIRGAWGVGKTHFWSTYVDQRIQSKNLNHVAYSYISLFGKSSLPDIRASIFQAGKPVASDLEIKEQFEKNYQESTGLLKNVPWLQGIQDKISAKARFTGWLTDLARSTPFTDKYSRLIGTLEYKLVSKYLICIDDLERKGSGLSVREIMGLVDELANQKKCKVVLIFNDRSLTEERDKKEFKEYREKVVDREVEYDPSHSETLSCVFPSEHPDFQRLQHLAQVLNIKNIRVLRKLRRIIDVFAESLKGVDPLVATEFLNHATMQVWAHFMQPEALPYDFVLSRTRESLWAGFLQKNEAEIPEEEKLYRALAHQINLSPSEYTDLIAEFIAKGYVDLSTVDRTTKRLSLKVSQQRAHTELGAVWHTYTDSFGDDESEIRAEFLRILDLHADKINISEYSAALDMLSTFDVDVNFLVEKYVTLHADELSAYNPSDPLLSRRVSFDPLRKKVNELISRRSNLTIDEVTLRISVNKGWNKEDIEYLASLSEEQIREWMLSKPSDMAGKIQGGLLFFSNLSGSSDEDNARYKQISDITIGALRSIASTSSLNKRRVSSVYSISLDS